jgi:hypothetical protein
MHLNSYALSTAGLLMDSGSVTGGTKRSAKAVVRAGVVGAGGLEPPPSSVSAKTRASAFSRYVWFIGS